MNADPLAMQPTLVELLASRRRKYGPQYGQCADCLNYRKWYTCAAFEPIPAELLAGTDDHRKPYPGDNGIQFEPIKEQPE